jgi:undecaprenyl-diphosphatase
LLTFAHFHKGKSDKEIGWLHSLVIGISQAVAVLPGLSRSGSTIATGIMLGNDHREVARFSFLMVLLPVTGAVFLDLMKGSPGQATGIGFLPMATGFISAFCFGWLACRWMIRLVTRGKLIYFAIYCFIIGLIAIFAA